MSDDLKTARRRKPGVYSRGAETVDAILKAALHVLVEEGAGAFTLQRIATECGLKVGHVNHHFPRKEMLVEVLLDEILLAGEKQVKWAMEQPDFLAGDGLARLIAHILDDVSTKQTAHLFTELWAMANHNPVVADRLEALHRHVHRLITGMVEQLNPALSHDDAAVVAIFIYGAVDGMTMFSGYNRPWASCMPGVKNIAIKGLVDLAKTITPAEIANLPPAPIKSRNI